MQKIIREEWQWGDKRSVRKTLQWYSSDDQKRYKQLKKRDLVKKWKDIEISYKFNEWGYRCDSFEKSCDVLFIGCSQAVGVGLPLEYIYSYLVSQAMDINHHSLATSGADWQHIGQRLTYWLPILKPKVLVLRDPPDNRFNWWEKELAVSTARWDVDELLEYKIDQSRPLIDMIDDPNALWYRQSIKSYIVSICKEMGIKLIGVPKNTNPRLPIHKDKKRLIGKTGPYKLYPLSEDFLARDYNHLGTKYHHRVAEIVLDQLKEMLH